MLWSSEDSILYNWIVSEHSEDTPPLPHRVLSDNLHIHLKYLQWWSSVCWWGWDALLQVGHTASVSQLVVFAPRVGKVERRRREPLNIQGDEDVQVRFIKSLAVKLKKL